MFLIADDINVLIIEKNIDAVEARLNRVIKQFETLFSNNILIVNNDKTKAMLFHLNKTCNLVMSKIVFKNVASSNTYEVKFLGINISNFLKWNTHIQFFMFKVKQGISSLRGDLSLFMLRNIHFTKFQSLTRYGIILWGGERESVKVLKIQKRVLCSIKGMHKRQSCGSAFK